MPRFSNSSNSLYLNVYIDEASTDVSTNTSTINWQLTVSRYTYYHTFNKQGDSTLSLTLDGQNVHSSNPVWEVWDGEVTLASGSTTISHNSDGRKTLPFSCTFNPNNGLHGTITVSGNLGLTAIPRSSSVSVSAGVIGSSVMININRQSSSFKHTVRYSWAGKSGTIATNVDTSTTWTIPLDFANDIPNSASGTGTIYVDTYSGSTKTGTQSTTFTASVPVNVKPTFSGVTLSDLNGAAQNLIPNGNTFIQVISNIKVAFNGAVGSYSSSITGYYAEIVGKNQSTSSNGGSLGIMNYHGTIKIRASVSDSRGRWSDAREVSVTVLEYFAPSLSFSIARTGSTSSTLTVTRNAKIAPLAVLGSQKNTMSLTFKVARLGTTNFQVDNGPATGSWTSISSLTNSQANLAGNYLANQSWVVVGMLEDKFTRIEFMVNVATESVVFSYDRSGVGVNKIRERGALDVKGDIYANDQPIQQHQLTRNNGISILTKESLDNILKNGMYYSHSAPDRPRNQNGWLLVQVYDDAQYVVQTYWTAEKETMLVRYRIANKWGEWKEVTTRDDIQKYTQGTPWQNLTLQNGWVHHPEYEKVQCSKTFDGVVYIRGTCKGGKTTRESIIFTLPENFRPSTALFKTVLNSNYGPAVVGIYPGGTVVAKGNIDANWLNFDNVSFKI
ncbi:capsid and scaffold protein [Streptococcus phage Javan345]|nr:capsid and scaffold protein [Streptococcus phage Javan345]